MSESQSQQVNRPSEEFLLEFNCSGSKVVQKDAQGRDILHLWRIYTKTIGDKNEMMFEVQYWENDSQGDNPVYAVPVTELQNHYPNEARQWEVVHGEEWDEKYANAPPPWSTGKRDFSDTPSKPQRSPKRRSRGSGSVPKNDGRDDGDDEEADGPTSQDDQDPFGSSGALVAGGSFSIPMRPPPLPRTVRRPSSPTPEGQSKDVIRNSQESEDEDSEEGGPIRSAQRRQRGLQSGMDEGNAAFQESQMELEADGSEDDNDVVIAATQPKLDGQQGDENEDDDDEVVPATQPNSNGISQYEIYSKKLIQAHSEDISSLVKESLELEGMPDDGWVTKRRNSVRCNFKDLEYALWLMLLAWDPLILEHMVRGDLPKQEKVNLDLKHRLEKLTDLDDDRTPCIYAHYFVNDDGESPTPRILQDILDKAKIYIRGFDMDNDRESAGIAELIDTAVNPSTNRRAGVSAEGERRYIKKAIQAATCEDFIAAAEDRIKGLPLDEPLERAFTEIGFAIEPATRLKQHREHSSSNYLMNFFEAISATFHNQEYYMEQYVVFHIVHFTHAMYAEILATLFCLGYATQGGGFSHAAAGGSHAGALKKYKDESEYYIKLQEKLANDDEFELRAERDLDKMREKSAVYNEFIAVLDQENEQRRQLKLIVEQADIVCARVDEAEARALEDIKEESYLTDLMDQIIALTKELTDEED